MAEKEFNLSERMSDWTPSQTANIKEFIKKLKEEIIDLCCSDAIEIGKIINKLAGEKLIC